MKEKQKKLNFLLLRKTRKVVLFLILGLKKTYIMYVYMYLHRLAFCNLTQFRKD